MFGCFKAFSSLRLFLVDQHIVLFLRAQPRRKSKAQMAFIHPALVLAFFLTSVSFADPPPPSPSSPAPPAPCAPGPTCGEFYPPGRQDMGGSWWSIGDQRFNVTLSQVTTFLQLPEPPQNSSGIIALDPALDNSVCLSFPQILHILLLSYKLPAKHFRIRSTLTLRLRLSHSKHSLQYFQ